MKRLFWIFFLITTILAARGDSQSESMIARIKAKINSTKSYRVNFSSDALSGTLTVSGSNFALISPDSEAYYDGKTLWNYNRKNKEVNIENLDPSDPNVMVNPSKLLAVDSRDFSHKSLSSNVMELTPKNKSTVYSRIVITVNAATSLPERLEIVDRESGDRAVIRISGFTPNVPITTNTFRFDPKKHKGIDVVDFR